MAKIRTQLVARLVWGADDMAKIPMKTLTLQNLKGRKVGKGVDIEVDPSTARVLRALKRASDTSYDRKDMVVDEPIQVVAPRKKRKYTRRNMVAKR